MKETFKDHAIQIIIIFLVLIVFLSNITGLVDVNLRSGSIITIRSQLNFSGQTTGLLFAVIKTTEFLVLMLTGLVLCIFLPVLNPIKASVLTVFSIFPPLYINYINTGQQIIVPMEYSLLTILMLYSINVLIGYFRETHSKQKIVRIFGQYVPQDLVTEISKHPEQISLQGESKKLTVFFCDLQDFSSTAEQLNPKQLAHFLNEYFTEMTTVLYKYGATIDKYIGDSIMAFWGAPLRQPDHAQRAVRSSFEMHDKTRQLSNQFIRRGWPGLKMGIGINTGMMSVGNMGSKYRLAYTVVGDAVNLGSRLENLTRTYKVPTIVSETTKSECNGILFRELDVVQVKGKQNNTKIFEPVCAKENASQDLIEQLSKHDQGMNFYHDQQWEKAKPIFEKLNKTNPKDKYYRIMLEKIKLGVRR